ncbi:bifunctional 4-hydroxy-2-oxoglutarate aldolase/2-dehydro-3-deoxy-phosphogluconate aldolase [Geodermatophilus sp. SYSU D00703]
MAGTVTFRSVAILRGHDPGETAAMAGRSWEIGVDLVEVPVQGDRGWSALESVAACAAGRPFGAGTVLTVADVERARDLGASVVISPGIDATVVEATLRAGLLPLPGVMTPTDVGVATRLGLTTCKMFPATVLGTSWLGAIRGPFPAMQFIAVGGIDLGNAAEYIAAGAAGVAFGSSIAGLLVQPGPERALAALHRRLGPGAGREPAVVRDGRDGVPS